MGRKESFVIKNGVLYGAGSPSSLGFNTFGIPERNTTTGHIDTFAETGQTNVTDVATGVGVTLIVKENKLFGTCLNCNGSLGIPISNNDAKLWTYLGIDNPLKIDTNWFSSFVVTSDNRLLSTGRRDYAQLGLGNANSSPVVTWTESTLITNVTDVKTTGKTTYAISNGSLHSVGHNGSTGELGVNYAYYNNKRTYWTDLNETGVLLISPGADKTVIEKSDGWYGVGTNGWLEFALAENPLKVFSKLQLQNITKMSLISMGAFAISGGKLYYSGFNMDGRTTVNESHPNYIDEWQEF
mgnify:CR=1 FL=1